MARAHRLPILVCPAASAALLVACTPGTAPEPPGPAAQVVPASDTLRAAAVATILPDSLWVRVVDAKGRGVPGHAVNWTAEFRGGTLTPTVSLTDEGGRARSAWQAGTRAGGYVATAQAITVDGPLAARFRLTLSPGPTAAIMISPPDALVGIQETRNFSAVRVDGHGNTITDRPVVWSSSNPAIASVHPQTGTVRGIAPGMADIRATSDGKAASARVTVAQLASGEDLFNSGTLTQYRQYADVPASWTAGQGVATAQGTGAQSVLIRNDVALRDGWVEAEMDRADEGGLVLRFRDQSNYYLLALRDDGSLLGSRNLELFRRTAGQWHLLAYGRDIAWPRGTVKKIRFEAAGSRLRAYADGSLLVEVTDATIAVPGQIGMRYNDVPESFGTDQARYLTLRWSGL